MKISPIPQGGAPGQSLTQTDGRSASAEKLAAAKQIAAGESPMKLAPSDTPVDPQVERAQASIRRIKMRTNASPERFEEAAAALAAEVVAPAESAISDDAGQANPTTEDTKPLSPQFAALAKQRRALQVKERELADREKALESKATTDGATDLIARLKSQPLSVLQEHGVTYDQLTEAILANQNGVNPEIQSLKAELKALKEGVDKNFSDRDSTAEQQVLAEMKREADKLANQGDTYEMIRETGKIPEVIELIHRTYKQTGEILDVSEAMNLIEETLINDSLKIANLKKIQGRLKPAETPSQTSQQPQKVIRTLTNRDTATTPLDRKARAIAAFHGTLKK